MKTYKDVYKFPLVRAKYGSWVYDQLGNFVFQFSIKDSIDRDFMLGVINGKHAITEQGIEFHHDKGYIKANNGNEVILIRGWGGLTGSGGMNLPHEEAANIQDTFAEYIVSKLNMKYSEFTPSPNN